MILRPASLDVGYRAVLVLLSGALLLVSGCRPAPGSPQTLPPAAAQSGHPAVDSLLRAAFPPDGPGAAVIVVRDARVVYRGAAGLASVELRVPMTPETVLPIFSVTKQFTGVAALMLVEEGKLSLGDRVATLLSDLPERYASITVEQLIAHTSGLANYVDHPSMMEMVHRHVRMDDLVALFRDAPMEFEPGARWAYNNSGYLLLGAIIERQSGLSYGDFVRSRIIGPLGMSSTYVYDRPDAIIPGRADAYVRVEDEWRRAPPFSLTHGYAVGNMLASVEDLARWELAIQRGELLSDEGWRRALTSFRLRDGSPVRYGAGWFLGTLGPYETAEHQGNFIGGRSSVVRVPSERLMVAVLANADPAAADVEDLSLRIAAAVLGIPAFPEAIALSAEQLEEYVGTFDVAGELPRVITRDGSRLCSQRGSGSRLELIPIGVDLFRFPAARGNLRFVRSDGRVVAVRLEPRLGPAGALASRIQ